jgi:hypothetical protein
VRVVPLVILAAACAGGDPWAEVVPARPALLRFELGATPDLSIAAAEVALQAVDVDRCDARPSATVVNGAWWVVPAAALHLEGGPWCGLSFGFEGPLALEASSGPETWPLALDLGPLDLPMVDKVAVDGDAFVLRLGADGWLSAADLAGAGGVVPGDRRHDALVAALRSGAGVWRDDDDGVLTAAELAKGPLTEP